MTKLLDASDNATGATLRINNFTDNRNDHERVTLYTGTFGGGTLTIEASEDNVVFAPIVTVTAAGTTKIFARFPFIRAVLTGATGGSVTAIYVD
ncbi:MAG: hypothetical protein QQN63_00065 [Nitrosopumilus sp.]